MKGFPQNDSPPGKDETGEERASGVNRIIAVMNISMFIREGEVLILLASGGSKMWFDEGTQSVKTNRVCSREISTRHLFNGYFNPLSDLYFSPWMIIYNIK